MSAVHAPKGFTIERTQSKDEANMGIASYRFSVDLHLDLNVVEESETDTDYLQMILTHGIRQLARNTQKRMTEAGA